MPPVGAAAARSVLLGPEEEEEEMMPTRKRGTGRCTEPRSFPPLEQEGGELE